MESGSEDDELVALDGEGRIAGTSALEGLALSGCRSRFATAAVAAALPPLFRDCELVDGPKLPDTFWLAAEATPTTRLEQLALAVFDAHTSGCRSFDRARSGAEWWVQLRDPAGPRPGVGPHWDKDENLRRDFGIFAHPQLSTVTYLTSGGAPTVVLSQRIGQDGGMVGDGAISEATVSQPVAGKHLAFDGRLLHLVAPELTAAPAEPGNRCTFLVNIWLHHKPRGLRPLPEALHPLLAPAAPEPALSFATPWTEPHPLPADRPQAEAEPGHRWLFGPRGDEFVVEWDRAPSGAQLAAAMAAEKPARPEGADGSTVRLRYSDGRLRVGLTDDDEEQDGRDAKRRKPA